MSNTEQAQKSKDKSIIQSIGYKEFSAICDEYKIVETATKELLELADDYDTEPRDKIRIYQWLIEMNIGKPRQISDSYVTTKEKPSQVSFDILENREGVDTKSE